MNRRGFLRLSLAGALSAPVSVPAQTAPRRIGFLFGESRSAITDGWREAFVAGLQEHGWIESRNIVFVERRYVPARGETPLTSIQELIQSGVEVLVVSSTQAALAAKQATRTVPIVMTVPSDPVGVGLVTSLARPGGNVTGLSFMGTEVVGKQVELLKEAVPGLTSVAVLMNPTNASHPPRTKEVIAAARTLRLRVEVVEASTRPELVDAVRTMVKRGAGAALILADPTFVVEAGSVIRSAAEQRLPIMYGLREVPLAGGLMSYGPDFRDLFRLAAGYVDKILRGAQPQDLPIEQASKFELVINLKTARALGLTLPSSLLLRADQVIE